MPDYMIGRRRGGLGRHDDLVVVFSGKRRVFVQLNGTGSVCQLGVCSDDVVCSTGSKRQLVSYDHIGAGCYAKRVSRILWDSGDDRQGSKDRKAPATKWLLPALRQLTK